MGKVKTKEKLWMLENIPKKKCKYCKSRVNLTYDHKVPLIQGGKTEKSNIQILCRECNIMKSNMSHNQLMNIVKWWKKVEEKRGTTS